MNRKLLAKINRALENTKATCMAPVTKEALQKRLTEELDWADADPDRWACIQLLNDVMEKVRSAGIVTSPGFGFLTSSFLLYLTGVTRVNPVEWDLPFSRFLRSFDLGSNIFLETGTGGTEVARQVLKNRDELIIEHESGHFRVNFLEGNMDSPIEVIIQEYSELDRFPDTIKNGWHRLDEATLRHFGRGTTDGAIWFESDKMREWLTDFGPESMSDLVLLNALYWPGRIQLFPEFLCRKLNPDEIPSAGNEAADRILRDTYGILLYQEQALMLQEAGYPVDTPFKDLAVKGHFVARTMLAVEAIWPRRMKTSLR
ncbi:MAG: hypothetical protein J6P69_04530 [Bacteroidales bacterium]|nr:hypothetical protein [Bacteroidales bacterium]